MVILTEKESVAKNYAKALGLKKTAKGLYEGEGKKIRLTYAAGHLYQSYDAEDYNPRYEKWEGNTLPIIPQKYLYKPDPKKKEFRKNCEAVLRDAVKEGEEIVIATDPDREGEVIARLILNALKADYGRVTRVWCCEGLDRKEIVRGLKERKKAFEYDGLARKGLCQKQSDWVMGINLTRCYSIINGELFSIGRVQSAVIKEIYEREREILTFIRKPYYEIEIDDEEGKKAFVLNESGKTDFRTRDEAEGIISEIMKQGLTFVRSEEKVKKEKPPRLFDLAKLESEAYRIYGFPIDKTEKIAQCLYNEKGVLSYPRTKSVCLKESDEDEIRKLYENLSGIRKEFSYADTKDINEGNKRLFNSEEIEGHHAIIPSNNYDDDGTDEWKVWDLVLRRFLMQGMGEYIWKEKKVYFRAGKHDVLFEGKEILRKGWKEADLHGEKEYQEIDGFKKERKARGGMVVEKFTEPPPHYNEATILEYMRNPGKDEREGKLSSIGTEATQATIVKTLFKRGYVKTVKKHIEIEEKGIRLVEQIKRNAELERNTSVESTTRWERLNEENPEMLLKEIEEATKKSIEEVRKLMETVVEKRKIGLCPSCGGEILRGKKGFYCSNWKEKECRNSLNYHIMGNEITEEKVRHLIEDLKLPMMEGVTKDGDRIKFTIRVVEGKFTIEYDGESDPVAECPKCSSSIFKFRKVYKCSNDECGLFFYRESSGVVYDDSMIRKLCKGEEIEARQKKKDGSEAAVILKIGDDLKIHLSYK